VNTKLHAANTETLKKTRALGNDGAKDDNNDGNASTKENIEITVPIV
jgi:hypothetical protein